MKIMKLESEVGADLICWTHMFSWLFFLIFGLEQLRHWLVACLTVKWQKPAVSPITWTAGPSGSRDSSVATANVGCTIKPETFEWATEAKQTVLIISNYE